MCQHLFPLAAMVIIVTDCTEDKAIVRFINPIPVMRLRLEQGIAGMLGIALKGYITRCDQTVKTNEFKKC